MSRKVIYLIILLLVFSAGGSCSRHSSPAYHGPNRVRAKPHKEWKKPKPRYKTGVKALRLQGVEASEGLRLEGIKA